MSIKVEVEISWEEVRAFSQAVDLAKDQLQDLELEDPIDDSAEEEREELLIRRSVASRSVSMADAFLAGVKGRLFDQIKQLPPGNHLRDHYWPYVFEVAGKQPSGES